MLVLQSQHQGDSHTAALLHHGFHALRCASLTDLYRCYDESPRPLVVLAGVQDGKAALAAGVSGAGSRIKAGELLAKVAARIGGKAGGRPDMAQGGGPDSPALGDALAEVPRLVADAL